MKKVYEKPMAEKIEFDYKNQVVASNTGCHVQQTSGSLECNKTEWYPTYQI